MITEHEQIAIEKRPTATEIYPSSKTMVSIIIAVQNQQDHLRGLHNQLRQALDDSGYDYEIIFIDDGSSDNSWQVLQRLNLEFKNVKILKLRTIFGEASALDSGLQTAKGSQIVYFTCRVKIHPGKIVHLIERLDQGADVVIGVRYPRRDSKLNQLVSLLFNSLTNYFAKLKLSDINSGVLAAKKEVFEHVPFYGTLNAFIPVIAKRQGYKIVEERIEQLPGHFNQSLYPKDYIRRFLDLISVLFLSNYSKKPLHFLGFAGAVLTLIGTAIDFYLFVYRILGIGGIAGKPMLLLGTLLFIIGIQMISIGLLGEIIIFTHAKDIKEYNIEQIIE